MKKTEKKNKVNEELDIKGLIITVSVIAIIVLVLYGLTVGAQKLGWFDIGYTKPELASPVISYENILAGTVFNKKDSEYYVLFADYKSEESIYLSSLANLYVNKEGEKTHLYSVDLGNEMNKSIIGETSNPNAGNVSELSINGHTLIKISGGRNVKYIEGDEAIKAELGV